MTSTAKVFIRGRNFLVLLERLKKHDVRLLKIRRISETETIITVKYKDLKKVFAISQNMWYNELVGLGGFAFLKQKILANFSFVVCALTFIIAAALLDAFVFKVDVYGASGEKLAQIYKIAQEIGYENGVAALAGNESQIEKSILETFRDVDFCTVKKSGNRLIINVFFGNSADKNPVVKKGVYALKSGKILSIKTYSGTALKNVGEYCYQNEKLVDGFYVDENGKTFEIGCLAEYTLECCFIKEYLLPCDADSEKLLFMAEADGQIDDADVTSYQITPTVMSGDKTVYRVKITYLYQGE